MQGSEMTAMSWTGQVQAYGNGWRGLQEKGRGMVWVTIGWRCAAWASHCSPAPGYKDIHSFEMLVCLLGAPSMAGWTPGMHKTRLKPRYPDISPEACSWTATSDTKTQITFSIPDKTCSHLSTGAGRKILVRSLLTLPIETSFATKLAMARATCTLRTNSPVSAHKPQQSDHDDRAYTKVAAVGLTHSPDWGHCSPGVPEEEMGHPGPAKEPSPEAPLPVKCFWVLSK